MKKILVNLIFSLFFIILVCISINTVFQNFSNGNTKYRFTDKRGHDTVTTNFVIVDNETGVMYLWCERDYKAGLTVMVDKDGKPLIYKGDNKQ